MPAKKSNVARMPKESDYNPNIYGLAKELSASLDGIAEELRPFFHVEQVADNLGSIASSLDGLAKAMAMQVIAQGGNAEDRAKAVEYLKGWFEEFKE